MADVAGPDFFDVDSLLSDEEKLVRDTVRKFVDERVLPGISKHFREETFPTELVREMGDLNLLGANLEGYGCPGLGNVAYGLIMQELERGDSGVRSFASVQSALVMYPIRRFGSDAQKERYLPGLAKGTLVGCFGLTEPDFGSDPGGMLTRARLDGGDFVLNGTKMWITNGCIADVAVVWAKDDEGHVRGFLVEHDRQGFYTETVHGKFSMRASVTSKLILEDCRVPRENLMPGTKGLGSPLSCLSQARFGIAWGVTGAAMACYAAARNYALSRTQFGKPIASFQLVQAKLADMLTEVTKAQILNLQLSRLKDENRITPAQISLAKRNNTAAALDIARMARDMHGANGIVDEYPVIRHMCNLETVKTYEGTHDIHTLILGEAITGIKAYQ